MLALDPAKPWFDLSDGSNTISKDDAAFVDVVHTNSGFLLNVSIPPKVKNYNYNSRKSLKNPSIQVLQRILRKAYQNSLMIHIGKAGFLLISLKNSWKI